MARVQVILRRQGVGSGSSKLVLADLVSSWMLRLGVHPLEDMAAAADAIAGVELPLARKPSEVSAQGQTTA